MIILKQKFADVNSYPRKNISEPSDTIAPVTGLFAHGQFARGQFAREQFARRQFARGQFAQIDPLKVRLV